MDYKQLLCVSCAGCQHPHVWMRDGAQTALQSPPGSRPSWSRRHPEQSLHLEHTQTKFISPFQLAFQKHIILLISRSCPQSSPYQTPVTPDSCWCPLKADTRSSEEEQRRNIIIQPEQMNEWALVQKHSRVSPSCPPRDAVTITLPRSHYESIISELAVFNNC